MPRWTHVVLAGALSICAAADLEAEAFGLSNSPDERVVLLDFADLTGWANDDHDAALRTFLRTCPDMDGRAWQAVCAVAGHEVSTGGARGFFELLFRPVLVGSPEEALFTGYFEPELEGSRRPSEKFQVPLHRAPSDLPESGPWATRAQIEEEGLLRGRGLELAWIADPVDKLFLQIQGSGRLRLTDGTVIRIGYGGQNGHAYRSVGQEMARRGLLAPHETSARNIRAWVRANPDAGRDLLHHNTAYTFFREVTEGEAEDGPLGAMRRPLTAGRSLAVDPDFVPLGAPVWVEKAGASPLSRLMVAQDTGSAIQGAQRADLFFGTGAAAGWAAGAVRDGGRMVVLMPIDLAYARVSAR